MLLSFAAMLSFQLLISAAAFSLLSSPLSAVHEAPSTVAHASVHELPSPSASVASYGGGCLLPNDLMFVLETVEAIGITRIDRTSKLVSRDGVADTERLPVRAPTWAEVSEPPRMPLFYSRMMSIDF